VTVTQRSACPDALEALAHFVKRHERLFVLTGAGCSTASGIPDYRDGEGQWKRPAPVQYRDFVDRAHVRRRYWARSLVGWRSFAEATPNPTHRMLARMEEAGFVHQLVTQNVDGLHQQAGSRRVIDLHGRLDTVECLHCRTRWSRASFQHTLADLNPDFRWLSADTAPDGDADLEQIDFSPFRVPDCGRCGGMLKPRVVFFGEMVPSARVQRALTRLKESAALLVVGSSLMVYSGYRFCRTAAEIGTPLAAINLGRTRSDRLLTIKVTAECSGALRTLVSYLGI
jgi:NAD-dependent SIR2 family protein deacetylase